MTEFSGNAGYAFSWPREFLATEVESLIRRDTASGEDEGWVEEVTVLLRQAFTSPVPANDFREIEPIFDFASDDPNLVWLQDLLEAARNGTLGPRPYCSRREQDAQNSPSLLFVDVVRRVHSLVQELRRDGYFDATLGVSCFGGPDKWVSSPQEELDRLVGKPHLWKGISACDWDEADLFDFIEVFHDLISRPTKFHYCSYCGDHHPCKFSQESGQSLYRGLINDLLDRSSIELRVAEEGEDVGRMVQVVSKDIGELVKETLGGQSRYRDEISHAITTFRYREGTVEQRRSAIVTLARIMERHRQLLKDELLTGDEKALFQIANQFNLRHKNEKQRADYDTEFLNWIFHWYLATINLIDRLSAKREQREV